MPETAKQRLVSVDFIRGLAVALMILANNPGDYMHVLTQFTHAHWNGWTATDFVFPIFLFLVGVSAGLAVNRDKVRAGQTAHFWRKALTRSAILFGLGLFENAYPYFDLPHLRILGVLQRIGLVYFAVASLHVLCGKRGIVAIILSVLIGYTILLKYVPVPGLGHPSLDIEWNWEAWVDRKILHGHVWGSGYDWDPEGVLSTFPAVALGLIGLLCGRWLREPGRIGVWRVFFYGWLLHMTGLVWHLRFPINKTIFSSSFVCFVGGAGVMLLALCHYLMDQRRLTFGTRPFLAMGANSLTIYVTSEIISKSLALFPCSDGQGGETCWHFYLYAQAFSHWMHPYLASLTWSLCFLLLMFVPAWLMYRRGVVIKI